MKIRQFFFLLIFCSLIVTNFTHPMDNSSVMTYKKKQTLMTELGVKCWKVIWKNPELLKSSIPDVVYDYCQAGYKNSEISIDDIRNKLDDYSRLCGRINLDSLTNKILELPSMSLDEAMTIAKNMKINDKIASLIVDNLNPNDYLLDKNYKLFSSITDEDNILLLKKIFYNKLRNYNRKKVSKLSQEKSYGYSGFEKFKDFNNSKLGVFHLTRTLSEINGNNIDIYKGLFPCEALSIYNDKLFQHSSCIDSSKRFKVCCYYGNRIRSKNRFDMNRFETNLVAVKDYRTEQRLLNIYLFPDLKNYDEYTPISISRIKLNDDGSVLFLKSGLANKKNIFYSIDLPVDFLRDHLSITQVAFICSLVFFKCNAYVTKSMLQKLRNHPVLEALHDPEKVMCLTYIDEKIENRNLVRIRNIENAIFSSENPENKKKRICSLLNEYSNKGLIPDDVMNKLSRLLKLRISEDILYKNHCERSGAVCWNWKKTYEKFMMSLSRELQSPTCISGFRKCSHQGQNMLSRWLNEVVESIPFMPIQYKDNLVDDSTQRKNAWYGISYVEDVNYSINILSDSMLSKKDKGLHAIDSFCKSDDLDQLYETISHAMIPEPLALQIRKKINKRMQSKTNDSEIDSEKDKTNLSKLVESFYTHCKTSGVSFAEELSSCFDLANKSIVLSNFKKRLGL